MLAESKGITPAQLASAWVIPAGSPPTPGTTTPSRMQENAAAAELTAEDRARIDDASPHGAATGARNTEEGMARDRG